MAEYKPLYEPTPFGSDDPEEVRRLALYNEHDIAMFAHVGYYVAFYATVEFFLASLLWMFTGRLWPPSFDLLIRGTDANVKIERLLKATAMKNFTVGPNLAKRLDHFKRCHVPLRNQLVHSYLYWPEGDALQVCGIGRLPVMEGLSIGPPPTYIKGLALFERAGWLSAFSRDLIDVTDPLSRVDLLPPDGILEIERPLSGLPTGHHHEQPPRNRRATPDKIATPKPREPRSTSDKDQV